jgi:hypothetical protein
MPQGGSTKRLAALVEEIEREAAGCAGPQRSRASAFREAAEKWRAGDRAAKFPMGSFPPGLRFLTAGTAGSA